MTTLEFFAPGIPAPQGSKRAIPRVDKATGAYTGKVSMVESAASVKPWRSDVRDAAREAMAAAGAATLTGPVRVGLSFYLRRPKGHYGTGRNAGVLKPGAPAYPAGKPDIDKLVRSTLDALKSAGVYADDGQVVSHGRVAKLYARADGPAGARITVRALPATVAEAGLSA